MVEFHRTRRVPRFSSLFFGVSVVQRGEEVGVHLLGTRGDGLRAGRSRDERKSNVKEFAAAEFPPNRAKRTIPRRSPFPRFHPLGVRMRGDRWEIVGWLGWEGGIGDERDDLHWCRRCWIKWMRLFVGRSKRFVIKTSESTRGKTRREIQWNQQSWLMIRMQATY